MATRMLSTAADGVFATRRSPPLRRTSRWLRQPSGLAFIAVLMLLESRCSRAEPVPGKKSEVVAQITAEVCDTCFALEDFIKEHKYVYVLLYKTRGRLNVDIMDKFSAFAEEWKWSKVHFGKLDTDKDAEMIKKWSDPALAPTNIMWKNGLGVEVAMSDLEIMKNKYAAGPEGQKWWLTKYLGTDREGANLQYVKPLRTFKLLDKFRNLDVALLGNFNEEKGASWNAFHEFVWNTHNPQSAPQSTSGGPVTGLNVSAGACTKRKLKFEFAHVIVPSVVLYVGGDPRSTLKLESHFEKDMKALGKWAKKQAQYLPAPKSAGQGQAGEL